MTSLSYREMSSVKTIVIGNQERSVVSNKPLFPVKDEKARIPEELALSEVEGRSVSKGAGFGKAFPCPSRQPFGLPQGRGNAYPFINWERKGNNRN